MSKNIIINAARYLIWNPAEKHENLLPNNKIFLFRIRAITFPCSCFLSTNLQVIKREYFMLFWKRKKGVKQKWVSL